MYRPKDILQSFRGLVGWQKQLDCSVVIADSLSESSSGLYFQQAHPLITLNNIKSIAPEFTGDIKTSFSEWLQSKTDAAIQKTISRFVNEKLTNTIAKSILDSKQLFDGAGRMYETLKPTNSIVGFELVPIRSLGISTKINRIGLQLKKEVDITIYLYHSSVLEPVHTKELKFTNPNSMQWFSFSDLILPYMGNNDSGGSWYIVYDEKQLVDGNEAIIKNRDWSKGPCTSCSEVEYTAWQNWSKFIEIHPFKTQSNDGFMWDVQNNLYTYSTNYGLNLDVSVECDITDILIKNKHIFASVILNQMGCDILRELAFNPNARINRNATMINKADILYELDGDSTSIKKSGMAYTLDQSYKALELNTQGLSRICLPCKSKGIKIKSIT